VNSQVPSIENDHAELVRYWFVFDVSDLGPDPGPPGTTSLDGGTLAYRLCGLGVGVTGYDEADCLGLIEELLDGEPVPPVVSRLRNVDVESLDLRSPAGVPAWRGVWYPPLDLGGTALASS
jgi:hypothetical protein